MSVCLLQPMVTVCVSCLHCTRVLALFCPFLFTVTPKSDTTSQPSKVSSSVASSSRGGEGVFSECSSESSEGVMRVCVVRV